MALKLSEDVELIPVSFEIIRSVQGSFRVMQSHLEKLLVVRMLTMLCFQFAGQCYKIYAIGRHQIQTEFLRKVISYLYPLVMSTTVPDVYSFSVDMQLPQSDILTIMIMFIIFCLTPIFCLTFMRLFSVIIVFLLYHF